MNRPSYLLLIVLLFFAAVVVIPIVPLGGFPGDGAAPPEPVVLTMKGPPPKGTVELSGRVLDVVGWPLASAQVTAHNTATGAAGATAGTTDADGRFRLRVAENESVELAVEARGGMQGRAAGVLPGEDDVVLVVEPPRPFSRDRAVDLHPAGSGLFGEGMVEDEEGQPVPRAVITVVETGVSVIAGEHGRYRVSLPAPSGKHGAAFHLIARDHSGRVVRARMEHTRQRAGLRPLPTLQVAPGQRVSGFLRDGAGNPAAGAGLVLSGQGQVRRVVTGADGEFGIQGLVAGDYLMSVLPHKGWIGFHRELTVGGVNQDVELQLRRERPLTILVLDQAGEPQAGVHLVVHETGYRSAHGHTGPRGRVILRGLGDGELTFTATRGPGQELEVLRYEAGEQCLIVGPGGR